MRISTQRFFKILSVVLLALFLQVGLGNSTAMGQEVSKPHVVKGTVFDENGKPMAGVGVIIATTLQGVVTDINGHYEIKATPVQELQFSFLGYKTFSAKVGTRTTINVSMLRNRVISRHA